MGGGGYPCHCWACQSYISEWAFKGISKRGVNATFYTFPQFAKDAQWFYCCGKMRCKEKIEAHLTEIISRPSERAAENKKRLGQAESVLGVDCHVPAAPLKGVNVA